MEIITRGAERTGNDDATIILGSFAVWYSDNLTILSFLRRLIFVRQLIINQGVRHETLSRAPYEIASSRWKQNRLSFLFFFFLLPFSFSRSSIRTSRICCIKTHINHGRMTWTVLLESLTIFFIFSVR